MTSISSEKLLDRLFYGVYYLSDHSDAEFSHGICPECFEAKYGDNTKKTKL